AFLVIHLSMVAGGVFVVQDEGVLAASAERDGGGRIQIEHRGSPVAPDDDKTCAHGDKYSVKGAYAFTNIRYRRAGGAVQPHLTRPPRTGGGSGEPIVAAVFPTGGFPGAEGFQTCRLSSANRQGGKLPAPTRFPTFAPAGTVGK